MSVSRSVARVTRKVPGVTQLLRAVLPVSLKRKLGSALLPKAMGGETVRSLDGRQFVQIPDRLFLQVLYDGIYEPSLTRFIQAVIKEDDLVVDIGANFGWYATLMAMTSRKTIAYEPLARVRQILEQNIRLNGQESKIDVRASAVGSEPGTVTLVVDGPADRESALAHVALGSEDNKEGEAVPLVKLDDDLSAEIGNIAFMKVDAEGLEVEVLRGAQGLLGSENPPVLITEANTGAMQRAGATRRQLCDALTSHGYKLFGMKTDGSLYTDDGKAPALAALPNRGKFASRRGEIQM